MDVEAMRKAVEDSGRRHYVAASAGDTEALDQLLADELVYTQSDGCTDDKTAFLERVRAGAYRMMTVDHSVDRFVVLSDDLAIVRGKQISHGTGESGATLDNLEEGSLDVWVNRDDRWQLIGHHETLVMLGDNYRKSFEAGNAR